MYKNIETPTQYSITYMNKSLQYILFRFNKCQIIDSDSQIVSCEYLRFMMLYESPTMWRGDGERG